MFGTLVVILGAKNVNFSTFLGIKCFYRYALFLDNIRKLLGVHSKREKQKRVYCRLSIENNMQKTSALKSIGTKCWPPTYQFLHVERLAVPQNSSNNRKAAINNSPARKQKT